MHACKHSTAAPASACPAFGHCAKHKPPQTATKLQQPGPGRSSLNRPPERPLNRPLNRPLETAHNSPNELRTALTAPKAPDSPDSPEDYGQLRQPRQQQRKEHGWSACMRAQSHRYSYSKVDPLSSCTV